MLIACGSAAAALLVDGRRARVLVMAVALAAAPVLVLGDVWDESRVVDFRESPAQIGVALVIGVIALAALVLAFRRWREAFPIAAFAVLPLRVPVEIGAETAHLLVPLYLVIAARLIAFALDDAGAPRAEDDDRWSIWLRRLLAATLVLYAIQAAYSEDVPNAIENIGFFLVPFAVMFALLTAVDWTWALLRRVLTVVAGVAVVCAAIAIYQWSARDLFLNPELFDSNQLHVYFRANSLFFDPNILGRYLALAITALGAYMAWSGERLGLALAAIAAGVCLTGLVVSFSITSFVALLAGLGIVALLRWGWRGAAVAAALGLAGLAGLAIAGGTPTSDIQDYRSIDSGRESLLEGGVQLFEEKPTAGWGSGAFGQGVLRGDRAGAVDGLAFRARHRRCRAGRDRARRLRRVPDHGHDRALRPRPRVAPPRDGRRVLRRGARPQPRVRGLCDRPRDVGPARPRRGAAPRSARRLGDHLATCSSTCAASQPRAPRTRPRACSRSSSRSSCCPVYTAYLSPADYGAAEVMLASLVAASILIRFGLIEALMRFYYLAGEDPRQVVATGFAALFWLATAGGRGRARPCGARSPRRFSTAPTPSSRASRCSASGC